MHGHHLRSLHFGPYIVISKEVAVSVLQYLPALEVCRFERLVAAEPYPLEGQPSELEPDDRELLVLRKLWGEEELLDADEIQEYGEAKKAAAWPRSPSQIVLPRLRVFQSSICFPEMGDWQLPSLEEVIVGLGQFYQPPTSMRVLRTLLIPFSGHITRFTYTGSAWLDPWQVLPMLPNLKQARFQTSAIVVGGILEDRHASLATYRIQCNLCNARDVVHALQDVQTNVELDKLPSLHEIYVEGYDSDRENILDTQVDVALANLEGLGVKSHFTFQPDFDLD